MDHLDQMQHQQQQPAMGVLAGNGQMSYPNPSYQPPSMVATGTPAMSNTFPPQQHPAFNQPQQFYSPQQQEQLQAFWANQMQEIEQTSEFKNHSLPLARIKKIMKADEDVRMISSEAPVIFSKACEMFILELTLRSWIHTEENKRRTLQKNDIAAAISKTEVFDFLVDIIPRDELKEEGLGITKAFGSPPETLPYYYAPPQYPVGHQAAIYAGQRAQPVPPPFVTWTQSQTQPPSEQQQQPE